jgi:hypothetical protein
MSWLVSLWGTIRNSFLEKFNTKQDTATNMKNSTATIQTSGSSGTLCAICQKELSRAEIEYAMQKEDACREARERQRRMSSRPKNTVAYIKPGPGSCMF